MSRKPSRMNLGPTSPRAGSLMVAGVIASVVFVLSGTLLPIAFDAILGLSTGPSAAVGIIVAFFLARAALRGVLPSLHRID